jgi:hypothetical protein
MLRLARAELSQWPDSRCDQQILLEPVMIRLLPILFAGLCWAALAASAADDESSLPSQVKRKGAASTVVRQESLELPGLTACHQCEWRPHLHEMGAAEQCGTSPTGTPKTGQFECGFSPDCERVCTFVRCAD